MRIVNDRIVFDAGDILLFSAGAQRAIQLHAGERISPEEALSLHVNDYLIAAERTGAARDRAELEDFVVAFAAADNAQRDQAKLFLNEARAVVGLAAVPAEPPTPEEPVGFMAKVRKFVGL